MDRRAAGIRLSMPKTLARPEVGWALESSILTKVVLPAPFGPSKPKVVPRSTRSDKFWTARNSCLLQRRRNVFESPSVSMAKSVGISSISYAIKMIQVPLHYGKLVDSSVQRRPSMLRAIAITLGFVSVALCANSLTHQERKE